MFPMTDLTPRGAVSGQELHASTGLVKGYVLGIRDYCKGRLTHERWPKPQLL